MDKVVRRIREKKRELDGFRPFPIVVEKNIEDWLRIELTYNSNAIEGNTLSRIETKLVVEEGITSKGKSMREHQEAINHAKAFDYVVSMAKQKKSPPIDRIVMDIHAIILDKINDDYKGRYRNVPVRIAGSMAVLPNYLKVPDEMENLFKKLTHGRFSSTSQKACVAHYELVRIHPFIDGNGRAARLLMNYLLLRAGNAPALIKKEERKTYIDAIETYSVFGKSENYFSYMYKTIERGLDEYLRLFKKSVVPSEKKLLKIGEFAVRAGITIPTVRHWTNLGLLTVADYSAGGYQLYGASMIQRAQEIKQLQQEGFRLDKIREKIL